MWKGKEERKARERERDGVKKSDSMEEEEGKGAKKMESVVRD